jgi:hypothetical protein
MLGGISLIFSVFIVFSISRTSFDILNIKGSYEQKRAVIASLFRYAKIDNSFSDYASTLKRGCRTSGFFLFFYLLLIIFCSVLLNIRGIYLILNSNIIWLLLTIPTALWIVSKILVSSNWTKIDYFLQIE